MDIYKLYVKTHNKTGKKYLGYTKQDPYTYKGSGKYWNLHLEKHGNDVWTNVIFQTELKNEIKQMGMYYSILWNVVESDEWANLKLEEGDGGFTHDIIALGKRNGLRNHELALKGEHPFQQLKSKEKASQTNKKRNSLLIEKHQHPFQINRQKNEKACSERMKKLHKEGKHPAQKEENKEKIRARMLSKNSPSKLKKECPNCNVLFSLTNFSRHFRKCKMGD